MVNLLKKYLFKQFHLKYLRKICFQSEIFNLENTNPNMPFYLKSVFIYVF